MPSTKPYQSGSEAAINSSQSSMIEWPTSPLRPPRLTRPTKLHDMLAAQNRAAANATPIRLTNITSGSDDGPIEWPTSPERPSNPKTPATHPCTGPLASQDDNPFLYPKSPAPSVTGAKRALEDQRQSNGPGIKRHCVPRTREGRERPGEPNTSACAPNSAVSTAPASHSNDPQQPAQQMELARVFLSQEQQLILGLVEQGESVFFTGSAGTGKSVLLHKITSTLKKKYSGSVANIVGITAPTGIAACSVGGITLHSYTGIGSGKKTTTEMIEKIYKNTLIHGRWLKTRVLIIDEVSMVDGELFDKLEEIARTIRKNQKPFGGIQLVITGDFFQLPPVGSHGITPKFAFEATRWAQCITRTFNLSKVFRQKDQEFVNMLTELRFGRLSRDSITRFRSLARKVHYADGIVPTELFAKKNEVESANATHLAELPGTRYTYKATDTHNTAIPNSGDELENLMAPKELELRINAQVMLIKNLDETLVNGSRGKVIAFVDEPLWRTAQTKQGAGRSGTKYPLVRFTVPGDPGQYRDEVMMDETWQITKPDGSVQATRTQIPLILAWAMSIHKSQGQTMERVKVNLKNIFTTGQAYVALSRATSLENLEVLNFNPYKVRVDAKVARWSKTLECSSAA